VERAGEPADPVWQQVEDLWDADPIRPAERVLAEAHGKATEVVTTAERKAAEITRSAAEQAAATITRAEREAAELRAAATKMTAELAGMTADVVASPRREAAENLTRPAKPSTRPGPRPGISPRRTPSARPGAKPKRRQVRTWRKMVAAVVVLSLGGLTSTATEIGLHGFRFFIFRSAGTGATPGTGVQENQGPGQPGAHLKAQENKPDGKAG